MQAGQSDPGTIEKTWITWDMDVRYLPGPSFRGAEWMGVGVPWMAIP